MQLLNIMPIISTLSIYISAELEYVLGLTELIFPLLIANLR